MEALRSSTPSVDPLCVSLNIAGVDMADGGCSSEVAYALPNLPNADQS